MKKYIVETYYTCTFKTVHSLDNLDDKELSGVDKRNNLINFAIELGDFLKSNEKYDKVNIAMLGNVVSQLHLHLVMRNKHDPAWPGPVWGFNFKNKLDENSKKNRSKLILKFSK